MPNILQQADQWFLVLIVIALSGYFLWSVKRWIEGLTNAIQDLKETIKELFDDRNDHARRITALETRCNIMHGKESR